MITITEPISTNRGFSLVELTISLVVIAILSALVLRASSMVEAAKASDLIAKANDLNTASKAFRERFKFWPGDMPNASVSIANLPVACSIGIATANIGDGEINTATEISCAIEELFQAGLIRADLPVGGVTHMINTDAGTITLVGASSSNVANFPPGINVIEFTNLRCALVHSMDSKIDDGNIATVSTGRARSSVPSCTVGGANDPVPFYAVAIN